MSVLEVRDLVVEVAAADGPLVVVDGVSLSVDAGETLGLVGESGSGKTLTALAVMRLLGSSARISGGQVLLEGVDLTKLDERRMRGVRGGRIGMVFQEPMTALDPAYTVGEQVAETVRRHLKLSRKDAWARAVALLDRVGIPSAERRARDYPHHFSGGMRQRVVIAMALSCEPVVLLADEPTTALDVTVQEQILTLLAELRDESGLALLFISHDFGVIADICDRVAVMYAGQVVETAPVRELFATPRHPYTDALLRCVPGAEVGRLATIPGTVPGFDALPPGCRFAPRCAHTTPSCVAGPVALEVVDQAHQARCVRLAELMETPS
ncbi:oligopeptide/dipeptide ABC transporter ATP-binding protein [Saccharothrix ecbatanensis]|uniref:Oligopeptide/dipeptide ABC transporter ATP-binding protein n=1 Tax=Saccharothrix ecbatanensis TaxID=1105145 RepID=A0A7W9HNU0_9PSEU|nr:ABC transporter ATP-binding protein [Saccharothrix ecbatanensis]MBB5805635.1 oligopeptide/dipeptide ABC transporter ATP-binding protein [Saccharothrix ecbatanensis]